MVWVVNDTNVIVRCTFIKHGVFENNTFFSNQEAWNEIFYHTLGQWPSGLDDPLWEMLFDATDGYAMLRVASSFVT